MSWISDAINWVNDNVVKPTYNVIVKPTYSNVVKPAYSQVYDWATSEQMSSVIEVAQKVGVEVEDGFVTGANAIHSGLGDTIKEKVNEGWQETTKFISKNACQIGVSTFVTGAVGTILTAEKELDFRFKLVEIILQGGTNGHECKKNSMREFSKDVSKILVEVIYVIPGIPGTKSDVEVAISFLVYKSLMDDNTNISSLKNLWSGALTCGITSYICDGSMPEEFSDWKNGIY